MEKIIYQLLSCLYLYDSGMPVPVCIRKQSLYTDFWRLALIHRAVGMPTSVACVNIRADGIPTSGGVGKFAQSRYTDFWRPKSLQDESFPSKLPLF